MGKSKDLSMVLLLLYGDRSAFDLQEPHAEPCCEAMAPFVKCFANNAVLYVLGALLFHGKKKGEQRNRSG